MNCKPGERRPSVRSGNRVPLMPIVAATIVLACAGMAAACGVVVTSAGIDQRHYHLPTVIQIRDDFPAVDLANLPTATGPLYHLVVAAISGPLRFGESGTQFVGALFAAALAALAAWHVRSIQGWRLRTLTLAPLLLSAYFWQAALWMLTDVAALLFAMAALVMSNKAPTKLRQLAIGLTIAAAIATRQTYVWLLVPACAAFVVGARRSGSFSVTALLRLTAPGMLTLAVMAWMWGGLTPPSARHYNAARLSMTAIPFVFAVAALFVVPILLAVAERGLPQRHAASATIVGTLAALPAVVWTSTATEYPDSSRRGGVLWSAVARLPDVSDRSVVLIVLAFIGGFTCMILQYRLPDSLSVVLPSSVVSLAFVTMAGAQLFPKYAELPLAMFAVLALAALARARSIRRTWPLAGIVLCQALVTIGIVVVPVIRALAS